MGAFAFVFAVTFVFTGTGAFVLEPGFSLRRASTFTFCAFCAFHAFTIHGVGQQTAFDDLRPCFKERLGVTSDKMTRELASTQWAVAETRALRDCPFRRSSFFVYSIAVTTRFGSGMLDVCVPAR